MKLYNSLSKKIEELKPLDDRSVRIYTCGQTVYDHTHIGNLSSYIFADTLRRIINQSQTEVLQVMNITDVDDKTIRRSREKYPELPPRDALEKLTTYYSQAFFDDMKKIGNDINAVTFLRATDHIESMKRLIIQLHEKGFAYIADDGVYFSIAAYKKSGKTYGQLLKLDAQNTSKQRIANDEYDKESAHDWALWKTQKPGEPAWQFELGGKNLAGRPGWHIECSAMSRQIVGQPFDIHTGGVDLVFPHHENEIAQSTAAQENPVMATMFAHNEHLLVDGKKMAKSAGNFLTLDDVIKKGFDLLAFRLLILQSQYRRHAHFSWQNLQAAQNRLDDLRGLADLRWQSNIFQEPCLETLETDEILACLQNDLDTPRALSIVSKVIDQASANLDFSPTQLWTFIEFLDLVFGLQLAQTQDITAQQKSLITKRQAARESKDFAESDRLRDQLKDQGIEIRDSPSGPIWQRKTVL